MKRIICLFVIITCTLQIQAQKFIYDSATHRFSMVSDKGKIIHQKRFIEIGQNINGNTWVRDTTGTYHAYEPVDGETDFFGIETHGLWGLINKKGKWVIKPTYHFVDTVYDELATVKVYQYRYVWILNNSDFQIVDSFAGIDKKNEYKRVRSRVLYPKYGAINKAGKLIIPLEYEFMERFLDGHAIVTIPNKNARNVPSLEKVKHRFFYSAEPDSKISMLIDGNNNWVKQFSYDGIEPAEYYTNSKEIPIAYSENITYKFSSRPKFYYTYKTVNEINYYGIMDSRGNEVIPPLYNFPTEIIINAYNQNGYLVDSAMTIYERPLFRYNDKFNQFIFSYKNNESKHDIIMDISGKVLYKADEKTTIGYQIQSGKLNFNIDNDSNTKIIIETICLENYDSIHQLLEKYQSFRFHDIINAPIYDSSNVELSLNSPFLQISRNNKYGVITKNGKEILPAKYQISEMVQYFDGDDLLNKLMTYAPHIIYIKPTQQYVYYGATNKETNIFESAIFTAEGTIIAIIPECVELVWDDTNKYYIAAFQGYNKHYDQTGKKLN